MSALQGKKWRRGRDWLTLVKTRQALLQLVVLAFVWLTLVKTRQALLRLVVLAFVSNPEGSTPSHGGAAGAFGQGGILSALQGKKWRRGRDSNPRNL